MGIRSAGYCVPLYDVQTMGIRSAGMASLFIVRTW